jgi:DNA polymerase III delta prime subunit
MHAFLILKGSKRDVEEFANNKGAKILYFTLQKIDDCRNLKKITKYSFSEKTAIVIENIDTATIETLNSFLKNLEEPNKNLVYVLTAKSLDGVLPTIISRCQIIKNIGENKIKSNDDDLSDINLKLEEFLKMGIDNKFQFMEKIKDREEAILLIENLILNKHKRNDFKNLENYLETLKNLKANGNVSLQLTNLLITSFS